MIKEVVYDYIRSFRWKNLQQMNKDENRFGFWGTVCYFLILLPITTRLYKESVFAISSYFLWAIPFCIGTIGIKIFPLSMKKIHFLCPMNKEERRTYSYTVYGVRILLPLLIEVVLGIILCMGKMTTVSVVLLHGMGLLTFFVMGSTKVYENLNKAKKESDKQFHRGMYMFFMIIYVITEMCTVMFMEQIMYGSILYRYALGIEILLFVIITIWCLRSLPEVIEKNCNYINEI